jgi:peptidyl-tRNA hydrolase, PTH1 family
VLSVVPGAIGMRRHASGVAMKLIVGLGNPGERYRSTRHNIGAAVVREFCADNSIVLKKALFASSSSAKARIDSTEVIIAVPLAYMNCSGPAVAALVRRNRIEPGNLLVVHDDLDIEFGRIKVREGGSAGGHNGLKSVISSVGFDGFCRLRIGIGRPRPEVDPAEFVLLPFTGAERKEMADTVASACAAVKMWAAEGISKTMNMFNR